MQRTCLTRGGYGVRFDGQFSRQGVPEYLVTRRGSGVDSRRTKSGRTGGLSYWLPRIALTKPQSAARKVRVQRDERLPGLAPIGLMTTTDRGRFLHAGPYKGPKSNTFDNKADNGGDHWVCRVSTFRTYPPHHWRQRAQELRNIAARGANDPDARNRLLQIADEYDLLARRADERLNAQ
jgi:hypothetical protein